MPPARRPGLFAAWKEPRSAPWLAALVTFLIALPLLWAFYQRHPLLYDTDSYYHLAVARLIAQHGLPNDLPWLRASAMGPGFGDKEPLFHLLLAPLTASMPPLAAGRAGLALLDALLLALLAGIGCRLAGWWGLLVPAWVGLGSLEVAWRLVRLRPELLSLAVLLLALAAAGSGRYRLLGLLAAVYALSYTAWHAFVGVFWLLFVLRGVARRRWDWQLLAYPLLGAGVGLLVHPNFPANLVIWKLVAWDFFRLKGSLDVGTEIRANFTSVTVLANLGFWLVALVLWRAMRAATATGGGDAEEMSVRAEPASPATAVSRGLADAFGVAALAFGLLYLLMSRFALYCFPFAALWLLAEAACRGGITRRVRLPFRGSVPTAAALVLAAVACLPGWAQEATRFARRTSPGPRQERLVDFVAFGRALPAGAGVAAPWGDTPIYLLWAPQGRYLNALDPMLMAVPHPDAYAAQRALFAGEEPDIPLVALAQLDSRYVAWSRPGAPPRLFARLRGDPRARPLHVGYQALFALAPAPPGSFVLDWRVVPGGTVPPPASASAERWPAYPRLRESAARAMEGFVDAHRVRTAGCVALVRGEGTGEAGTYELAASGPVKLWVDDELLVSDGGNAAVLGEGVTFRLPASRRLTVLTCPGEDGRNGFYLLRRG
ncbi:MAG TPA: hypothetical protein VN811_05615 [Thermoanaerobaculia bacterium]|nr:hypothetical protein [Thermoanaerobaculia bacterium]HXT50497.1 hypothetical protein [Thermoanaerobaculia bacterium]